MGTVKCRKKSVDLYEAERFMPENLEWEEDDEHGTLINWSKILNTRVMSVNLDQWGIDPAFFLVPDGQLGIQIDEGDWVVYVEETFDHYHVHSHEEFSEKYTIDLRESVVAAGREIVKGFSDGLVQLNNQPKMN